MKRAIYITISATLIII